MKKYFLIIMLLMSCVTVFSQWTSLPFTLVDDNGDPMTGQGANVKFTKYPHTYPDDIVSGITITEIGTQGTYNAKGFTDFQYVKMWLSGVARTEFDSLLTGNIFPYLQSNFWRTNASQTSLSGSKSISSGNWTVSTGDWLKLGGTETWYKPYIYTGSPWYTDISTIGPTTLMFKLAGDSLYGLKSWYYDGDKLRLLTSGNKWYGRTSSTSPIELNSSHFQWTNDKLNLLNSAVNIDSIKHNNVTVGKDSTWIVLGEPVTKWRFISLKKGYWYNAYTIPDWKWVYTSFNESGVLQAMDSMMVINEVLESDNETSVLAGHAGAYVLVDSVTLLPGKYYIDFGILFERDDHDDANQIGIQDTVEIALKEESTAPNVYIKRYIRDIHMYIDTNNFSGTALNWSASHTVYGGARKIYLYARYLGQALSNALSRGLSVKITRGRVIATLIR